MKDSRHIAGLDGLRGIAILSVLLYHLNVYFFPDIENPVTGGFLGVDLFFVLSGFLITWLSLGEYAANGSLHIGKFYLRRALRLLPALLFFLWVMLLLFLMLGELPGSARFFFSVLFYFHNWMVYFTLQTPEAFGHLWSLSIEEQFYIFWPLLLFMILRTVSPRRAIGLLGTIIVAVTVYRFLLWNESPNWLLLYLRTDLRVDGFLAGALAACLWHQGRVRLPWSKQLARRLCLGCFLLLVITLNAAEGFYYQYGAAILNLLAVLWIMTCTDQQCTETSYLGWKWLVYLGTRSYGMYLWHFPVFIYLSQWLTQVSAVIAAITGLAITLLITEFSFRVIEKPFNRLRKTVARVASGPRKLAL